MTIARVALPVAISRPFDYWVPRNIAVDVGAIVKVTFGRRRLAGVVVEIADDSAVTRDKLLPIDEVAELPPLPDDVRALCTFVATYYQAPPGLAFALALPPLVDAKRDRERVVAVCAHANTPALNAAQQSAVDAIDGARDEFVPFLLRGETGSGKTLAYLRAAERSIAAGGQVLLLVPEINLTPQLVAHVRDTLPGARTVVLHSALARRERLRNWLAAARGEADILLGTRLSVFTPMPRLALIVVDEEHDGSYKQHETVRYHARDTALWRARERNARVVLASATPSLETCAHASAGRYRTLFLARRADPQATRPMIRLVPARGGDVEDGLSSPLIDGIAQRLACGEQSLVFVNRRGYAPALKCVACGYEAGCPRCSARTTVHRVPPSMICHHCGHRERIPAACPQCGNVDLHLKGEGTQRLEARLRDRFPDARIARVDRDTTRRRGAFDEVRDQIAQNELDILIGTQMLAKGHDFPRLTLVGVLGADNALYSAEFRATERLFALLLQVAGRAGRASLPGEVIVQTDFPLHPLYASLVTHDYDAFAATLMAEREASALPPFSFLALLAAEAHQREDVDAFMTSMHQRAIALSGSLELDVEVFAPVAALLARRAGYERSQMLFRSTRRGDLVRALSALREALEASAERRVRWAIDVDPTELA
ncbi:MAG TPA: primosomal protein N' [Casimicrobiaceae bacterium]|nr:primosomal protein N' [Casimicrobiaceae bacterium]